MESDSKGGKESKEGIDDLLPHWIVPDWPAPKQVRAYVTTREGDRNAAPYDGFNTADHVGDDLADVEKNRGLLTQYFQWQRDPLWLNQVHGTVVVDVETSSVHCDADSSVTTLLDSPCAIHTADCLPVFFTNQQGTNVALAHAGWRGLLQGVLENTLARFAANDSVYAWMGPAIGPSHFEVGVEVYQQFVEADNEAEEAFKRLANGRYLCDLYAIARQRLVQDARCSVYGGGFCTYSDPRFFSYRQKPVTGRLLSLIWIDSSQ